MELSVNDQVFNNFVIGLFFYLAYIVVEMLVQSKPNNQAVQIVKFAVIGLSILFSSRLIIWIAYINMYFAPALMFFSIITGILVFGVLIKVVQRQKGKTGWFDYCLITISLAPLIFVNISYYVTMYPSTFNSQTFNGWQYHLVYSRTFDHYDGFENIYKCPKRNFNCTRLVTDWSSFSPDKIVFDEVNNEVHFIGTIPTLTLMYTDSSPFRHYDRDATAKLGNYLFFLSVEGSCPNQNSCKMSTYQLYTCEEGFTACHPLPIIYTDSWSNVDLLEFEVKGENVYLYAYDEDYNKSLVFVYGDNPKCFKEGCVLSNQ